MTPRSPRPPLTVVLHVDLPDESAAKTSLLHGVIQALLRLQVAAVQRPADADANEAQAAD